MDKETLQWVSDRLDGAAKAMEKKFGWLSKHQSGIAALKAFRKTEIEPLIQKEG